MDFLNVNYFIDIVNIINHGKYYYTFSFILSLVNDIGGRVIVVTFDSSDIKKWLLEDFRLKDNDYWDVIGSLADIGDSAVEPLVLALKDEDSEVRSIAAKILSEIGDYRAVEPLILALKDENVSVRWHAADALGEIGDKRAVGPLILTFKDEDANIRSIAAKSLSEIGKPSVEPLLLALKDDDSNVRNNAADALAGIRDKGAVEPFIQALDDEDLGVRSVAKWALGKIRDKGSARPLIHSWKREKDNPRVFKRGS